MTLNDNTFLPFRGHLEIYDLAVSVCDVVLVKEGGIGQLVSLAAMDYGSIGVNDQETIVLNPQLVPRHVVVTVDDRSDHGKRFTLTPVPHRVEVEFSAFFRISNRKCSSGA